VNKKNELWQPPNAESEILAKFFNNIKWDLKGGKLAILTKININEMEFKINVMLPCCL